MHYILICNDNVHIQNVEFNSLFLRTKYNLCKFEEILHIIPLKVSSLYQQCYWQTRLSFVDKKVAK